MTGPVLLQPSTHDSHGHIRPFIDNINYSFKIHFLKKNRIERRGRTSNSHNLMTTSITSKLDEKIKHPVARRAPPHKGAQVFPNAMRICQWRETPKPQVQAQVNVFSPPNPEIDTPSPPKSPSVFSICMAFLPESVRQWGRASGSQEIERESEGYDGRD